MGRLYLRLIYVCKLSAGKAEGFCVLELDLDGGLPDVQTEHRVLGFCSCLGDRGRWHRKRVAVRRDKTLIMWIGERFEYLSLFTCWESPRCRQGHLRGIGIEFAGSEQAHMPLGRVGYKDYFAPDIDVASKIRRA